MSLSSGDNERRNAELQDLDLSGVQFPSDRLTIADLRLLRPALFDHGFVPSTSPQPQYFFKGERVGHAANDIGLLLMCERQVAVEAYGKARGLVGATNRDPREVRVDLRGLLRRFGLCKGKHDADEMIRDIARQAERLANAKGR